MALKNYHLKLKGFVGYWDFDPDYVDYILEKNDGKEVDVLIDSTGGSLGAALSICAAFRNHGNVRVHYVGLNASAATIASMGAKHVSIDAAAMYLVHKGSQLVFEWAYMNADQIDEAIEKLDKTRAELTKMDLMVAQLYARRCKKSKEELLDLMKEDTWLTAQEALEWGFVDEITDADEEHAPKMDKVVACKFEEAGIPLPPGYKQEGMLSKMAGAIAAAFRQTPKKIEDMTHTFTHLCAALGVENIEGTEERVELSVEQCNAIDQTLGELHAAAEEDQATIRSLEERIIELEAAPGDESDKITADGSKKGTLGEFADSMQRAREMLNSIR